MDADELRGTPARKQEIVYIRYQPNPTNAPRLDQLAKHFSKNVTSWSEAKRELGEHVVLPLPLESKVLPKITMNINMMLARLQVDRKEKVVLLAEIRHLPDRLIAKLRNLEEGIQEPEVQDETVFVWRLWDHAKRADQEGTAMDSKNSACSH